MVPRKAIALLLAWSMFATSCATTVPSRSTPEPVQGGAITVMQTLPSVQVDDGAETHARGRAPAATDLTTSGAAPGPYRLGVADEIDISVFGYTELSKTQAVRPDGKIAFPVVGEVQAVGLSPGELAARLREGLRPFVVDPQVSVIIRSYRSKKIIVLGQVTFPGVIRLDQRIGLVEAISLAGGLKDDADLRGALLVRDDHPLPVNFERVFRSGDLAQSVDLESNDVIIVPSIADRKVLVMGEVKQPCVAKLKGDVTLLEALAVAGGLTIDAKADSVVLIHDGLNDAVVSRIDVAQILNQGVIASNVLVQPGDIIYVPRSFVADLNRFLANLSNAIQPVLLGLSGYALARSVTSPAVVANP